MPIVCPVSVAWARACAIVGLRRTGPDEMRLRELREAEVEYLHLAAFGDEDVRRLDVAVDDAGRVRGVERVGDLDGIVEEQRPSAAACRDAPAQRRAVEHLHDEERQVAVLADVIERADVRMVERRRRAGLALKALDGDRVLPAASARGT